VVIQMRNHILTTLAFALSAPTIASAAPAFSGDWSIKTPPGSGETTDREGTMKLAGDTGVVCGFYQMSNYSGWIGGKVVGDKVEGSWVEDSELGGLSFSFAGKAFKGTFGNKAGETTGEKGKDYWNGTKLAPAKTVRPISALKTAQIEWNKLEKLKITFTIKGSAVTGKMTYKNSGDPGGTLTGTLTGNHLVGTWKGSKEGGGRFQLIFHTGSGYQSVRGTYSHGTAPSCTSEDGGFIEGVWNPEE
jgi:hypothetical protein